ncbi:serine--tRNA ligase [Beijerinckia indica]|uniref:Serine--tRNA ligase n=1 Tax=Beijerinckia indica subsp. indica (strain ATCC 9039 / DSM 1715 / NCIMB 8712) TaxID=395963 RepID=SYS_BEII9|nr:serine--tRNA ligase [Beijerinckia indica]B2IJG1.1 RecName: Full=Serine--tRNA ligase; AltName: Full=Seryl-tRNA synthetase; Short=SerRS; AltName: Full=Seryl-tRNA(Ser/Sec) synthetase [Beijerinckia indica subsp. indica ATCC 9039]ACB96274.1 seryl-tRNA synthetase [Beijerinckia indica subsp. indica ATCC 9039]
MYDIKWIRDNSALFDQGRERRGLPKLSAELLALDDARRAAIAESQAAQERRNAASKEIGAAMKAKDNARAEALKAEMAELKAVSPALEEAERLAIAALDRALAEIPNLPLEDVPFGRDENDNPELRVVGEKPVFSFVPKEHFDIGEGLGLMDFEAAAKLSGARFVVNKGPLARLERALGQFMLDLHTGEHGYTEVNPPILARDDALFGTAQLPKLEEDMFAAHAGRVPQEAAGDLYWLIPTSEVVLTNLVRETILDEKQLPLRFTACTPCFRAEAGSAGRDTRGMIRQHQFTKTELVSITTPEEALVEHERMLTCAEEVLKRLGLAYRVVTLCTGDMGFASQKTYDIEVWLPGQGRYREISSCSVCGDFQARRMNARYRPEGGKTTRFVHTLNGSGVAVGRALVAVLENYQREDGGVNVPRALLPYMGGITTITRG